MPRPLSIALIATLCFTFTATADDKAKPSPVAKRILDKAVAEVKKNQDDLAKANAKPLAEAKKALEDQSKKLIEEGKADEATAMLGQVKTLEADVMRIANASENLLMERLAGKWTVLESKVHYRFEKNGQAFCCHNADGAVKFRGTARPTSDEQVAIAWETGDKDEVQLASDDIAVLRSTQRTGRRVNHVLERAK